MSLPLNNPFNLFEKEDWNNPDFVDNKKSKWYILKNNKQYAICEITAKDKYEDHTQQLQHIAELIWNAIK